MGRTSFFVLRGRKEVVSGSDLWVRGYVSAIHTVFGLKTLGTATYQNNTAT